MMLREGADGYILSPRDSQRCASAGLAMAWCGLVCTLCQIGGNVDRWIGGRAATGEVEEFILHQEAVAAVVGILVNLLVGALLVGLAMLTDRAVAFWRERSFRWMQQLLIALIFGLAVSQSLRM